MMPSKFYRQAQCLATLLSVSLLAAIASNAQASDQAKPKAQWVTLGTSGGPAVQVARSQIANALIVNDAVYLFDVGNGVQRQMAIAHVPERNVKAIFLSHHHLDHNASLGSLIVTHWTFYPDILPIIGPAGTKTLAEGLAKANEPTVLAAFPTAGPAKPELAETFRATDLPDKIDRPSLVFEDANIKVWAISVDHYQVPPSIPLPAMPRAVAYRVEAGGRTFVFSGDTGPTDKLVTLAKGADLLITEVVEPHAIAAQLETNARDTPPSVRASIIAGMTKNHLEPAEIGKMASAAHVGEVVLTHFVPSPEDAADPAAFTRAIRLVFKGKVTAANDRDRF